MSLNTLSPVGVSMKSLSEITVKDMKEAMDRADEFERVFLEQALHCNKTSIQWLLATNIYNSIVSKKFRDS